MPSSEAIEEAREQIEQGLRANDLAKQEIQTLRRAGLTAEADAREKDRRALEAQLLRLRAIVGT